MLWHVVTSRSIPLSMSISSLQVSFHLDLPTSCFWNCTAITGLNPKPICSAIHTVHRLAAITSGLREGRSLRAYGGIGAVRIEKAGVMDAFAFAIDELASLIGNRIRPHLRPLIATNWCSMDWIHGSYSHALPGQAHARELLARPIAGRLFFAGEATHLNDFSTAHGALESGVRAAGEVLSGRTPRPGHCV